MRSHNDATSYRGSGKTKLPAKVPKNIFVHEGEIKYVSYNMLSHPLKRSTHSLLLTQASIIRRPSGDASCKNSRYASCKASEHASCKSKWACIVQKQALRLQHVCKGGPQKGFWGYLFGHDASGAKVHGCGELFPMIEAMEPQFYGTLGLFSGPLNLFPRPQDLLLVLFSIFRLLVFSGIRSLFIGPPRYQQKDC